jgi:hypothetical protein
MYKNICKNYITNSNIYKLCIMYFLCFMYYLLIYIYLYLYIVIFRYNNNHAISLVDVIFKNINDRI